MENKKIVGIFSYLLIFLFVIGLGISSSLPLDAEKTMMDFDNVRGVKFIEGEEYPELRIENSFGLGKDFWIGRLNDNTNSCEYCSAETTITLDEPTELVSEVRFMTLQEDGGWIKQDIREFKFYVEVGVVNTPLDDYENQCSIIGTHPNGTDIESCIRNKIGSHIEKESLWEEYPLGMVLPPGVYKLKLEGIKKPSRIVDWQIKTNGEWLEEWAIWGGTGDLNQGILTYFTLNGSSGPVVDSIGLQDLTNNGAGRDFVGIQNNSFDFDGATTTASAALPASLELINFTYNVWFNTDDVSAGQRYILELGDDSVADSGIRTDANILGANIFGDTITGTTALSTATWYMATITRDTGTSEIALYLNGVNEKNLTIAASVNYGTSKKIVLGARDVSNFFDGRIDEVSIWNRSLSASEILTIYNGGDGMTYPLNATGNVTLNSPTNGSTSISVDIVFDGTATINGGINGGVNLTNMSLWHDESGTFELNQTIIVSGTTNTTTFNSTISGTTEWNIEACDTDGDCGFAPNNYTLFLDADLPLIDVSAPVGILGYNFISGNETLNVTFTDANLDTCWFNYNGTNVTIPGCLSGVETITNFTLELDNTNLTVYANDSGGSTNSSFTEWSYELLEISQNYSSNISEGESDIISATVVVDSGSSLTSSLLEYNGTNFTTSRIFIDNNFIVSSTITAPLVSSDANVTFNFYLTVDSTEYKLQTQEQEILNLNFDICGGLSNDTLINASLFDEGARTELNGTIEFNARIISKSSGEEVSAINGTFEGVSSGALCFSPVSFYDLYFFDAEIRYSSDEYATEFYYIQKADMSDYPVNLSLFSLKQNDSTEFAITYKNDAFIFTEGAVIQLQRRYVGDNVYEIVEAPLTGNGGKAVLHIDLNTNRYRISVVKDGVLLDFFENTVFDCNNELSGECTHSLEGTVDPNNDIPITELTDFSYTINIDEDNQTITVLFAVPSGTPSTINVLLEQIDMFGNLTACNTTVITSAGSITCGYVDTIEKSILELSISKNDIQLAVSTYVNDPELDMDSMNFFIVFLFTISLVGMAIASPEWMILISVMVLMISGTLLLINGMNLVIGLGAIAWVLIAAAIIIFKLAKQEDR